VVRLPWFWGRINPPPPPLKQLQSPMDDVQRRRRLGERSSRDSRSVDDWNDFLDALDDLSPDEPDYNRALHIYAPSPSQPRKHIAHIQSAFFTATFEADSKLQPSAAELRCSLLITLLRMVAPSKIIARCIDMTAACDPNFCMQPDETGKLPVHVALYEYHRHRDDYFLDIVGRLLDLAPESATLRVPDPVSGIPLPSFASLEEFLQRSSAGTGPCPEHMYVREAQLRWKRASGGARAKRTQRRHVRLRRQSRLVLREKRRVFLRRKRASGGARRRHVRLRQIRLIERAQRKACPAAAEGQAKGPSGGDPPTPPCGRLGRTFAPSHMCSVAHVLLPPPPHFACSRMCSVPSRLVRLTMCSAARSQKPLTVPGAVHPPC
jgi:hypothetical protein